MEHRLAGLVWVRVSQCVCCCDVLVLDEAICRNIQSCTSRFAQKVRPNHFRCSSDDLVDIFVNNLWLTHAEAALFLHSIRESVLWPVKVGARFAGSPLHNFVVLLKAAARADPLLAAVAPFELVACKQADSIVGHCGNAGGRCSLARVPEAQVSCSLHFQS